jgi:hypothetical protein
MVPCVGLKDRLEDSSNISTGFIQEETLWRGSPERELEPTAAYRLEVDIGEGSGGEIFLVQKIFLEQS